MNKEEEEVLPFLSRDTFDLLCVEYGYQPPGEHTENEEVYAKCMHKIDKTLRKAIRYALIQTDDKDQNELVPECIERVKKSVKILK